MATNLIVRNVDEEVALALEQRAPANGRSSEAEHREILKAALKLPRRRTLADVLAQLPEVGEDADFDARKGWDWMNLVDTNVNFEARKGTCNFPHS